MFELLMDIDTECVEINASEHLDEIIWNAWRQYNDRVHVVHGSEYCIISAPPNSGIHLYFTKNTVVDSLEKIRNKCLSENSIRLFLAYGYLPCKETLYEDVFCVPMGCCLKYDYKDGSVSYVPIDLDKIQITDTSIGKIIKKGCQRVIREARSDIWLSISGGLDSSVLYYELNHLASDCPFPSPKINLLNIYTEGGRDETEYLHALLENDFHNLNRFCMNDNDAWEAFVRHAGRNEIFGFPIVLKYEYLMKEISDNGGKALVMGDGPDEAFVCEKTYEAYVDHQANTFLPIHMGIINKSLKSFLFSSLQERNTWAQYNMIFQGSTNVRFLCDIAASYGIKLYEPYLDIQLSEWCILHASELAKCGEKEELKRYARGRIPDKIIDRSKMGFNSDYALWNKKGSRFYDALDQVLRDDHVHPVLRKYRQIARNQLEQQSTLSYDPQKRTGGTGIQSFLFCYLLLSRFCDRFKGDIS